MRSAGLGTGALTLWLYGAVAAAVPGLPPMPPEIAAIIACVLMELANTLLARFEAPNQPKG